MGGWLERLTSWGRTHTLLVDAVLAAVLAATVGMLTLLVLFDGDSEPAVAGAVATRTPWTGIVALAVAAQHVSLAWRRARPLMSFIVVSAGVGIQLLTSIWWLLPSVLLFLLSLYSYCAYGRHRASIVGPVVAAGGTIVVTFAGLALAGEAAGGVHPIDLIVRYLPFVLAAWALGMWRRVRVAYIEELRERVVRAEAEREERAQRAVAEEQARIAREMHDVLSHALAIVVSQAQGGRYTVRDDPAQGVEVLGTIARTGKQALADLRGVLSVLRSDRGGWGADSDGAVPQPTLAELPELFERFRAAGLSVSYSEDEERFGLSPMAELAAFRLIQEALTNTLKHAGPTARAMVHLDWSEPGLTVVVEDDGSGPSTTEGGQGLSGMRERVAVVGGSVRAEQPSDGGFRIRAYVPGHQSRSEEVTR